MKKKKLKKKSKAHARLKGLINRFRGKSNESDVDNEAAEAAYPVDEMHRGKFPLMSRYTGVQSDSESQKPVAAKRTEAFGPKPGRMHEAFGRMKDVVKKLRRKKHKARM